MAPTTRSLVSCCVLFAPVFVGRGCVRHIAERLRYEVNQCREDATEEMAKELQRNLQLSGPGIRVEKARA